MDRHQPHVVRTDLTLLDVVEPLHQARPELSARTVVPLRQAVALCLIAGAIVVGAWTAPAASAAVWHALLLAVFSTAIVVRAGAAIASVLPQASPPDWVGPKPTYAIIAALYREHRSVADLIAALQRLDYPHDKLTIFLTLEADDQETLAAIMAALPRGQSLFKVLITPDGAPRTKPRALNYALAHVDAEFVCIYDAEDRPAPSQLNAALAAFQAGGPGLACVQAPLLTDNARASWLSAQFSVEYTIHFMQLLPLLARLGLPLPLGGTSNHFRTSVLRAAHAWDPYNVTEDADLGYRLARQGWRIGVIAPPTFEEAPARWHGWSRQRSRWIKGHLQTWLVLMRDPFRTLKDLGGGGFFAMHLILAGGVAAAFLHAPFLALLMLAALTGPSALDPIDWTLAMFGCGVSVACALCAAYKLRQGSIARAALSMPLYWPLTFIPALRALVELIGRPHYWAKTDHALTKRDTPKCPPPT